MLKNVIRKATLIVLGLLGVLAVAPTSGAQAGTYFITATGSQFCALGNFIANVPGFGQSCGGDGAAEISAPSSGSAYQDRSLWEIDSPSGALTITDLKLSVATNDIDNDNNGYGAGTYWNGGGTALSTSLNNEAYDSGPILSQYAGIQLVCDDPSGCDGQGSQNDAFILGDGTLTLQVQENQVPGLDALGSNNIYYQSGKWIWNTPGDPWPASLQASDPSGVCSMDVDVDNQPHVAPAPTPQNMSAWQQCDSGWTDNASVDTNDYVQTSGTIPLTVTATNAALLPDSQPATLSIDNIAPTVSITPLNDSNPGGWSVNHPVELRVTRTVGPSGYSSFSCSDTVGAVTKPLTLTADPTTSGAYDATIDGNGSHTVDCEVGNNAVDPNGDHHVATAAQVVDIDEQPPDLSFEPVNPANPDQVVVDFTDNESAPVSGSISIAPKGSTSETPLPTTFSNGQLLTTIPDATLKPGAYTLEATGTSQVGNSATVEDNLGLPLRTPSDSVVSFAKVVDPFLARKVKERVLVGYHMVTEVRHGKKVRVKRGGHYKTITVIKRVERCQTKRLEITKHRWKLKRLCEAQHVVYKHRANIKHGHRVRIYGELTTNDNVAIAGQSVEIFATPVNGRAHTSQIGTAITDADGGWSATIPPGPSRRISVTYPGSSTLLPTTGSALVSVAAKVQLTVDRTASGVLEIRGRLIGGYVPAHGVAMRLLIGYEGVSTPFDAHTFRTNDKGRFSFLYAPPGAISDPIVGLEADMDGQESDYPFTPNHSPLTPIVAAHGR